MKSKATKNKSRSKYSATRQKLVELGVQLFLTKGSEERRVAKLMEAAGNLTQPPIAPKNGQGEVAESTKYELDRCIAQQIYLSRRHCFAACHVEVAEIEKRNVEWLRSEKLVVLQLQQYLATIASSSEKDCTSWPITWVSASKATSDRPAGNQALLAASPRPTKSQAGFEFMNESLDWAWSNDMAVARAFRQAGLEPLVEQGAIGISDFNKQKKAATVAHHGPEGSSTTWRFEDALIYPQSDHFALNVKPCPTAARELFRRTPDTLRPISEVMIARAKDRTLTKEKANETQQLAGWWATALLFRTYAVAMWELDLGMGAVR